MRCFLLLLVALAPLPAAAQRPLTHADYDQWKSLRDVTASLDGHWVAYAITPEVGDGELVVRRAEGDTLYRQARGTHPRFTEDGAFLVFTILPPRAARRAFEMRKLKRQKKTEKRRARQAEETPRRGRRRRFRRRRSGGGPPRAGKQSAPPKKSRPDAGAPKNSLGILRLSDGKLTLIKRVKSWKLPEFGPSILAYQLEKPVKKKPAPGSSKTKKEAGARQGKPKSKKKKVRPPHKKKRAKTGGHGKQPPASKKRVPSKKYLREGSPLWLRKLSSGKQTRIAGVLNYGITRKKGWLWYACSSKLEDAAIKRGFFCRRLSSGKTVTLVAGAADTKTPVADRRVTRLAFVSNRRDRDAENPTYDLYAWDFHDPKARRIVSHVATPGFPQGKSVSPSGTLRFCRDGSTLTFQVKDLPKADPPLLLPEDQVTLDLWHYKDPLLQPMQAKRSSRTRGRPLLCAYPFDSRRMAVLSHHAGERISFMTPDGSRVLVTDSLPYAQRISWDGRFSDIYVANTLDGSRRLLVRALRGFARTSPDGRYVLFLRDRQWHTIDVLSGVTRVLTASLPHPVVDEQDDHPAPASAYGIAGWTAGDREVVIEDRFDLWLIAPDASSVQCITDGYGRANHIRFRYVKLDEEERAIPADRDILLSAFDTESMASGYWSERLDRLSKPKQLVMLDKSIRRLMKPKRSTRLFYTVSSFRECQDLWTSSPHFQKRRRLSDINPQQKNFRWGHAELVHWHSADGIPLKGILIKPDGFNPKKKYPMLVYFYERLSSTLHRYHQPAPGTSPNPSYYISNGYLWFVPDIVYQVGYPGESCVKCVVSGVQALIDKGFVDKNAIGAAGHSWGGYQTAFLVTRTKIFKAVESGAPVSNMTSSYGGIRWGSGMSRAFQYEKTQSRIGGSLWEYPLRYLENSPLFSADKVETPIMIMHNDHDGAVPWYQGIEYFCALRRLHKEAYLFNYNGANHGLRRRANQMDWTKRMQQFFDHHLRGAPLPDWMKNGVPYIDRKQEKRRFDPVKPLPAPHTTPGATPAAASGNER